MFGDGTINGREINWYAINGGINARELDADIGIQFNQAVNEVIRTRVVVHAGGFTVQSVLGEIIRTKVIEPYGIVRIDGELLAMVLTQLIDTEGDIQFEQSSVIDVLPAMLINHIVELGLEAQLDHVFFSHWIEGTRLTVPAENRGMQVARDNRTFMVPPDDDELVPQKDRELVS